MSAARLPLLVGASLLRSGRPRRARGPCAAVGLPRWKSSFAPRHGKAVAPVTWDKQQQHEEGEEGEEGEEDGMAEESGDAAKAEDAPTKADAAAEADANGSEPVTKAADQEDADTEVETEPERPSFAPELESQPPPPPPPPSEDAPAQTDEIPAKSTEDTAAEQRARTARDDAKQSGPLEAVLHMGPPGGSEPEKQKPSMSPAPYVHHFDSYSLVKHLEEGGYTSKQAVTSMKGIRTLLAQHLEVAQSNLVSKSGVENETYLFSAACSELRTEVKNNRRLQDEQARQQRTHLQHEVDVLSHALNQELLVLNDTVRGMFNDRKMAVSEQQKRIQSMVQQLSYKITIALSSDARSEIEGLRGVLIRRSILGIIFLAVLTLGTLQYATYVGDQRRKEDERLREEEQEARRDTGRSDHSTAVDAAAMLAAN